MNDIRTSAQSNRRGLRSFADNSIGSRHSRKYETSYRKANFEASFSSRIFDLQYDDERRRTTTNNDKHPLQYPMHHKRGMFGCIAIQPATFDGDACKKQSSVMPAKRSILPHRRSPCCNRGRSFIILCAVTHGFNFPPYLSIVIAGPDSTPNLSSERCRSSPIVCSCINTRPHRISRLTTKVARSTIVTTHTS